MRAEYLIEAYFSNRLSPDEQKELEDLLSKDKKLKSEFDFQVEVREAIRNKHHRELKDKFRRLDKESGSNKSFKWLAAAASIIILLGLGWFYGIYSTQTDYNALYTAHFEVYPNVVAPVERSQSDESSDLVQQAFSRYENGEFEEAYTSFEKLQETEGYEYAVFYAAVSRMASGNYDEAIGYFKSAENWKNPEFEHASKWYLALAYFKKEDKNTALHYLRELQKSDNSFRQEAADLIEELEAK